MTGLKGNGKFRGEIRGQSVNTAKNRREKIESDVDVMRHTRKQYFLFPLKHQLLHSSLCASLDHLWKRKMKSERACRDTLDGLNRSGPQSPYSLNPTVQRQEKHSPFTRTLLSFEQQRKQTGFCMMQFGFPLLQGEKGSKMIFFSRTWGKLIYI